MKKLVIAEKPSVGRDIARVLGCKQQGKKYIEGNEYIVTWGLGHLVTLADPEGYDKKLKTWRMEDLPMMPERFKLVVIPQTRGQFQAVKSLIERKDVGEIIIATDAGREGELVARWILAKAGNKQTLNIMQSLYEHHKVLTYPRTDSRYLTTDVAETLRERVEAIAVGPYRSFTNTVLKGKITPKKSFVNNQKVSDHHAIIPTEQPVILAQLSVDERKIFDLVVRRFLAVLYPPYEYEQTKITIQCEGETFFAEGNVPLNRGYKEVTTPEGDENGKVFPSLKEGEVIGEFILKKTEGKTKPPARFTEGTLLKAMENPVKYMQQKDAKAAKTLQETGGLGTVATRADIIDKLFGSYLIEKKENEIFITGKAKQLLSLVPEDLKKPELTAEWESRLSAIAKGKASDRKFMKEIETYTKELMKQIQNGTGTFRHDNLTNKVCPECGKRLLLVNGKQGKLYVCQDRECGYKERISRMTNARCPVCHKKMELIGAKENQKFVCSCGHKESMQAFENRRKREGAGVSKKDVANYMKKMKKEEKQPLNNALADALANLKL